MQTTEHHLSAAISDSEFTRYVNAAFRNYRSVLELARSPLANSTLVAPLLVLDDVSPTAEERGHALRLLLRWATNRLAPETPRFPFGSPRPYDDPTWRESHWWRYNILRHRYLEPLHPDEFVEGGRFTETLLALTGIPSADTFFDERNRAIREVARWLRQQLASGQADEELRQLALQQIYRPLQTNGEALALLAAAATFEGAFPRALLLEMAAAEGLPDADRALQHLTARRFLLAGDDGQNLWLSPVLRGYVYARQPEEKLRRRHLLVAGFYRAQEEWVTSAKHLQRGQRWQDAAHLLLTASDELINELQLDELHATLTTFRSSHLSPQLWVEVQILLCDLLAKSGQQEEAVAACRRALAATDEPIHQARIYRRLGKLYEKHNPRHALGYYQQAIERFPTGSLESVDLLKDRAWLYILRQEWEMADADLALALETAPVDAKETCANIFDALASLQRHRKRFDDAIRHAQTALVLREATGDLLLVAASSNNLGLIYNDMGEFDHAVAAFREAMKTYESLGNRNLIAGALLNIGMAYHLDNRLREAVEAYRGSLAICREIGLPLVEVRASYNLAESLAQLKQTDAARTHWDAGYRLALSSGFDDEVADFLDLAEEFPEQLGVEVEDSSFLPPALQADEQLKLNPDEDAVCSLIQSEGRVTAQSLMAATHVSKATATRRLARWVGTGLLWKHGQGRGTYYTLARATSLSIKTSTAGDGEVTAPTDPPEQRRMQKILAHEREQLVGQYALAALGIVPVGAGPAGLLRLAARFDRLPDLRRFFALENLLSDLLAVDLDLIPYDAAMQTDATHQEPRWFWQSGSVVR